ncbi:MAG: nucleobase:cation symporter, family [Actinomycetota bacterium]|nr:nucleobase:cation symporter, family [Actinomycetota bacterium]
MADDDDARGTVGPDEIFSPSGPRRSNFTPPTNDAESLEAAANLFNDDAIAAALAAELAKVASGPIPIVPPADPGPQAPLSFPSAPSPEPWRLDAEADPGLYVGAPAPTVPPADAPPPPGYESNPRYSPITPSEPAQSPFDSLFDPPAAPAPVIAPPAYAAPINQGPLDDGTGNVWPVDVEPASLTPTPSPTPTPASSTSAPLPPAAASPAPPIPPAAPSPDQPPHRRSLADDELLQSLRGIGGGGDGTLDVIEQLQTQLELRAREAREYAVWEQSMLALGTPDAAAALDQARAEFAGVIGSAPVAPAPSTVDYTTPEPFAPAEPFTVSKSEASTPPPPSDEPSLEGTAFADLLAGASGGDSMPPPADLVATPFPGFTALPEPSISAEPELSSEPAQPTDPELRAQPEIPAEAESPVDPELLVEPEQLTELQQPFASVPTVGPPGMAELPVISSPAAPEAPVSPEAAAAQFDPARFDLAPFDSAPESPAESTFAAFTPPTNESFTGFAAPVDPQHLTFTPPVEAPFDLAPPVEPAAPFEVSPSVEPAPQAPAGWESPVFIEPPSLIEPVPIIDQAPSAWAEVSVEPVQVPAEPPAQEWQAPAPATPPATPPAATGIFDDLVTGSAETPKTEASPSTWFTPEPSPLVEPYPPVDSNPLLELIPPLEANPLVEPDPSPDPTIDPDTGGKRPFGEGVERDNAVDPTDSIFATGHGPAGEEPLPPEITPELVKQRIFAPELAGQEPTPVDERIGRAARMFWLWFAANSSIVAVVLGAIIFSLGMSLREALVATFAGVVVSFLPLGLGTLAGKRSGQPTMVVSRATFGVVGNVLPASIALLSRLFWAAALLWILGAGGASILEGARLVGSFTTGQVTIALGVVGFVLAVVIAYFGYALIAKIQLVISIISAVLIAGFIALTVKDVNVHAALARGDKSWVLVLTGAVLVFSFVGVAWSNSSSDLARYQRVGSSGGASMLWATFGAGVPTFILIAYGVLLDASNPRIAAGVALNPLDSLGRLLPVWYPLPLLAVTMLSLLSGAVLAMYSGGFAVQTIGLRVKRSYSTLIVGGLVLVIALILATSITDYTQLIRDFATTVAVPVAAWSGMFAAEVMIRNRRFDSVSLVKRGGAYADVRWPNLIAFVVITVVGLGFASATIPWLAWEGYLFPAVGVAVRSNLAASDFGVFAALLLGLIFPLVAGVPAIRRQERTERAVASVAGRGWPASSE